MFNARRGPKLVGSTVRTTLREFTTFVSSVHWPDDNGDLHGAVAPKPAVLPDKLARLGERREKFEAAGERKKDSGNSE